MGERKLLLAAFYSSLPLSKGEKDLGLRLLAERDALERESRHWCDAATKLTEDCRSADEHAAIARNDLRNTRAKLAAAEARAVAAERERDETVGLLAMPFRWCTWWSDFRAGPDHRCGECFRCRRDAFLARLATPGDAPK